MGLFVFYQRFKMTLAVAMNLRNFPYDVQTLKLFLTSFTFSTNEVEFLDFCSQETIQRMNESIELNEWELIHSVSVSSEDQFYADESRYYSTLIVDIPIARRTGFYIQKIFSLIFIIGLMVVFVPLLDSSDLSSRFQITLTLLLSQIAFNFAVGESLPKVSYSTSLDYYFLANYLFLCFSALENIAVYIIGKKFSLEVAETIDGACIFIFLVIHLVNSSRFLTRCLLQTKIHKEHRKNILEKIEKKKTN